MPIDSCSIIDARYHCLFCHGYEEHGVSSAGVLAIGDVGNVEVSLRLARMARRMTSNVTVYTNGAKNLNEQLVTALSGDVGIKVNEHPITRLEKGSTEPKVIVHLADGSSITEGFLVCFQASRSDEVFLARIMPAHLITPVPGIYTHRIQVHKPKTEINGPFARQLSLELTPQGDMKIIPPWYESTVPGVFAVGDCATPLKAVTQAVAMGTFGAAGLAMQLQVDRT